jgi:hypothetical protein
LEAAPGSHAAAQRPASPLRTGRTTLWLGHRLLEFRY